MPDNARELALIGELSARLRRETSERDLEKAGYAPASSPNLATQLRELIGAHSSH